MLKTRYELNASWPEWSGRARLTQEELGTLDKWIADADGLGAAGVSVVTRLPEILQDERGLLDAKMHELERGGLTLGDLRRLTKVLIGVAVGCVLIAVGAGAGGAVAVAAAAGALEAVKDLAVAGFVIAVGAAGAAERQSLASQQQSPPPAPA